jgi:hypothetical protein
MGIGGYGAFVKLNVRRLNAGVGSTFTVTPPIDIINWSNYGLVVAGNPGGKLQGTWQRTGTAGSGSRMEWQIAGPYASAGKMNVEAGWRVKITDVGTVLACTVAGLRSQMWYWLRVRSVKSDGQVTPWLRGQAQAG